MAVPGRQRPAPCGSPSLLPSLGSRCVQLASYLVILSRESASDPASVPFAGRAVRVQRGLPGEASMGRGEGDGRGGERVRDTA